MRRRDGGNDGAMRPDHIDQSGNFTGMIHTQFKDTIFGILRQTRQRERHADMIVEAALGSMGFARFGQRIGKAGFGSGFADTAGNGNDLRGTAFARGARQAFQSAKTSTTGNSTASSSNRPRQNLRRPKPPPRHL